MQLSGVGSDTNLSMRHRRIVRALCLLSFGTILLFWVGNRREKSRLPNVQIPQLESRSETDGRAPVNLKIEREFSTPFSFYGRTEDEEGNAIPGVSVEVIWTDLSQEGFSRKQLV